MKAVSQVFCPQHGWVDMEAVTFLNVHSNLEGNDVCTFTCKECGDGVVHESVVTVATVDDGADYEEALEHDGFLNDAYADADVLASAGMGTDEDYGYFGGDDY